MIFFSSHRCTFPGDLSFFNSSFSFSFSVPTCNRIRTSFSFWSPWIPIGCGAIPFEGLPWSCISPILTTRPKNSIPRTATWSLVSVGPDLGTSSAARCSFRLDLARSKSQWFPCPPPWMVLWKCSTFPALCSCGTWPWWSCTRKTFKIGGFSSQKWTLFGFELPLLDLFPRFRIPLGFSSTGCSTCPGMFFSRNGKTDSNWNRSLTTDSVTRCASASTCTSLPMAVLRASCRKSASSGCFSARPTTFFTRPWRRGCLRGRRGTWWHPPSFHVAGVAQTHIHLRFAWQAWHLWHWVARLVRICRPWRRGCLRGRRGTWWHPPSFHVAGVAQTHIHRRFAWQAWHHLWHTLFHTPLCHTPSFTHHFVTHHLSPHPLPHTTLSPHYFSHTTLSHTIFDTPSFTHFSSCRVANLLAQHVRAGLGKPWSASNANKPSSSWPLKQGPKKWSKHGCDKGTLTVATGLGTHKEKKVWVDIHFQAAGSQNLLAQHVRASAKFSDGWPHFWVQIWTPKWGPELDHIFIPSFKSLLGPRFGIQMWTQKWGQPSENFAAARRGFASRFATH